MFSPIGSGNVMFVSLLTVIWISSVKYFLSLCLTLFRAVIHLLCPLFPLSLSIGSVPTVRLTIRMINLLVLSVMSPDILSSIFSLRPVTSSRQPCHNEVCQKVIQYNTQEDHPRVLPLLRRESLVLPLSILLILFAS